MQPVDLVLDVYGEIFSYLKPYALNQASRTSKAIRQIALTEALWKKHLENEFPYCLEKGTSFKKYTKCKWKSLSHIEGYFNRKCILLIEAGHLNEIVNLRDWSLFDVLNQKIGNKYVPLIMNEQGDQPIKDYFFTEIRKETYRFNYWAIIFGKVDIIVGDRTYFYNELFQAAVQHGSIASLEYFYEKTHWLLQKFTNEAVSTGSIRIVKWFDDHGIKFDDSHLILAATQGNEEIIRFFLEINISSKERIKKAIELAVSHGRPSSLEVLLPYFSQDKAELNHLLEHLDFYNSPNETAACLKFLLENGADVDHPKLSVSKDATPLLMACNNRNNEMSIEILLNKGACPSKPLKRALLHNYNIEIFKMMIEFGAVVTKKTLDIAKYNLSDNAADILKLLESHAIS